MSISILAFAENFDYHHDNDDDYSFLFLPDDEAFPPLNSTTSAFEVISDDVLFTDETTVWVNKLSYAEAAEHGGVVHEPINIHISLTSCKQYTPISNPPAVDDEYGYDDDSCIDTLYYDAKSFSADKAAAENITYARKLKTAKYKYHRDLRKNLRSLPNPSDDMTQEETAKVREAKALVSGCERIFEHLDSDYTRYSYYRDRFYDRIQVKGWHKICHRRMLHEYRNDPIVIRLEDEFEAYARKNLPLFWESDGPNRMSSCRWSYYRFNRRIGFHNLHIRYSNIIKNAKEGADPDISKKKRLWLIRYAIPEKKYISSKLTRVQCAYATLDDLYS